MIFLQDHVVSLMVIIVVVTFAALLLAPLFVHMRWESRQRRRGGRYMP